MKNYIGGIDGLRAIAVVSVLLFHAFPGVVRGGFIGVDIFFVVSGFIITKTYFSDLRDRRIALSHFFMKRVRRLAPIYVVVLLATTVASYCVLRPAHLSNFAESLAAQPFYLQNLVFWSQGEYFDLPLSKPLLHTWSLAVEEQFYLAYAALILLARRAPRLSVPLIVVAAALSFGLGCKVSEVSAKTSFYWLPTRMWELAIGVVAARATLRMREGLALINQWAGLALMVFAVAAFDEKARFPGVQSLAACGGVTLALMCLSADQPVPLRVLTNRLATYVGKLSYSLYLWHWPIIAIPATYLERPLRPWEGFLALTVAVVVSHIGYTSIERPIRIGTIVPDNGRLLKALGVAGIATVGAAVLFLETSGAAYRYPPDIATLYIAQQQRSPYRCPVFGRLRRWGSEICPRTAVVGTTNVLVIGDSHADQLDEVIADAAAEEGMGAFLTTRNCSVQSLGTTAFCGEAVFQQITKDIVSNNIKYIFFISFLPKDIQRGSTIEGTTERFNKIVERVFLTQVVPNDVYFDPAERARALLNNEPLPPQYTMARYLDDNQGQLRELRRIVTSLPGVALLDPSPYLCPPTGCAFDTNGIPNFFDTHHLSPTGAQRLRPMFVEALKTLRR